MKTILQRAVVLLLALLSVKQSAQADVTSYAVFKVANFHQVDTNQPAGLDTPNAYYVGAQLFSTNGAEETTNAQMEVDPTGVTYPMPGSPVPLAFFYNSSYYPDDASMTADFPGGEYDFSINDGTETAPLYEPATELFTSATPYFTGDTWSRLQHVNAARPLRLCWNQFVPAPGTDVAWIFVRILDPDFNYAYTTNFIAPDVTNICIPADTLAAGTPYQIQLLFSDRAANAGSGFNSDALATVGFDCLTYTSLITIPPLLCIAPGTNAVILSWSVSASNFALESTSDLAVPNWCPVTNVVSVVNCKNIVVVPACRHQQFYQLYQAGQP